LSYLSSIVDNFQNVNIALNVINFTNLEELSESISISKRGYRGYKVEMSPGKKFIYMIIYDGYQATLTLYSLVTFRQMNVPKFFVTDILDENIKYSMDEEETLICSRLMNFHPSIGKWGHASLPYHLYRIGDVINDDITKKVMIGPVKENYYKDEDIEYLWQCDLDDIEGELRPVETYKLKYCKGTNELLLEIIRDEEFFNIFPEPQSYFCF
jgi:hypothetical protein